jgi:putative flippase GtrA
MAASFLGLRYFVFRTGDRGVADQVARFLALYTSIACLHGIYLLVWSDILHWDYRLGFLLASGMQFVLSYTGNKALVFDGR